MRTTRRHKWYDEAASWANSLGIVTGDYGNFNGDSEGAASFPDAEDVAGYARVAVRWAASMLAAGTLLSACAAKQTKTESMVPEGSEVQIIATALPAEIPQTGWTAAVPASYTASAAHQGVLERLDYASKDYARDGAGEYFNFGSMKNVFDNLIEKGDIKPVIMVLATFCNENSDRDFGGSIMELRAFHQDFENALMPAVEGKYHTYAQSTAEEDLKASRDHRAFAGFSLG